MSDYNLINNTEDMQYEFHIESFVPRLEYKLRGEDIFLQSTIVPKKLKGKGIGSMLIEMALMDVEKKNLNVIPTCPFVISYIKKYPKWKILLK